MTEIVDLGSRDVQVGDPAFSAVTMNAPTSTTGKLLFQGTPDGVGYHFAKIVASRESALFSYASALDFYVEGKASGTTDTSVSALRLMLDASGSTYALFGGANGGVVRFHYPALGTYVGYHAGNGNPGTSTYNTLFGYEAGAALTGDNSTGGHNNCFFGLQVGPVATSAFGCSGFGLQSLQALTVGAFNTGFGIHTLLSVTTGTANTAVGGGSMEFLVTGDSNTACGMYAGRDTLGSSSVFLGFRAGQYDTNSNVLYIDNNERTDLAGARANAMVYGNFGASAAAQLLRFNAHVGVGLAPGLGALFGAGGAMTSGAIQYGVVSQPTFTYAAGGTSGTGLYVGVTFTGAFTVGDAYGMYIEAIQPGTTTLTRCEGLHIEAQTGGATNWAIRTLGSAKCEFGGSLGIFGATAPTSKPAITGSRGSATAAVLALLLTAAASYGFITDSTTA